ncbi:MAG: hypothetical protein JNL11_18460 [Bdellovibrionaceae bacterium]|nr:hypothetical protein [Pseudobdellovibrionaceae bacterium]
MFRPFLWVFLFLLLKQPCWAEYRVFELEITTYSEADKSIDPTLSVQSTPPEEIGQRIVISTLDPEQYRGYHTVQPNEHVRYIATWRCRGRTSYKDYCPNPKVKTEASVAPVTLENK